MADAKKKKGVPRFAQDVMRVLGGQVAMTGMGVLTGIITARWLGPTDRGLFNLLVLPKADGQGDSDRRALWGEASVFCQKR